MNNDDCDKILREANRTGAGQGAKGAGIRGHPAGRSKAADDLRSEEINRAIWRLVILSAMAGAVACNIVWLLAGLFGR